MNTHSARLRDLWRDPVAVASFLLTWGGFVLGTVHREFFALLFGRSETEDGASLVILHQIIGFCRRQCVTITMYGNRTNLPHSMAYQHVIGPEGVEYRHPLKLQKGLPCR